jgi:hypothetical protein
VLFNNEPLAQGTYRLYAIPGAEAFEIGVNSELGKWGYSDPDYSKDVLKTKVPVENLSAPVEQFTITLQKSPDGIDVVFDWSDTRLVIPVKKK